MAEITRPKTPLVRGRPTTPLARDEGDKPLETDILGQQEGIHWDPVQTFASGVAGAIPGASVAGPWGAAAGFSVGALSDVAAQIAHNQVRGLPWFLGLPAEIAAAVAGGKLGGKLVAPRRTRLPLSAPDVPIDTPIPTTRRAQPYPTVEESTTFSQPSPPRSVGYQPDFFVPAPGAKDRWMVTSPTSRNVVTGQWPNVKVAAEEIPSSSVTGQWPNLQQKHTDSLWRRLINPPAGTRVVGEVSEAVPGVATKVKPPKASKGGGKGTPSVQQVVETAAAEPGSVWSDVAEWGRTRLQGAGQTAQYLASPLLSAIERAAGPVIGKQLVALEGTKSARQAQIWQELFGGLIDDLRTLPKALHTNFVDALEGRAAPVSQAVAEKVDHFKKVFGTQGTALLAQQKAGLKVSPLENYFMHEFEPAFVRGLVNNPERQRKVINDLVSSGAAVNKTEARVMLKEYMQDPKRGLFRDFKTGAEYKRSKNYTPYISDPVRAVSLRGRNIAQRLAELEVYGAKKSNLRALTSQLDRAAMERTRRLIALTRKRDPIEEGLNKISQTAMSFQAVTSLSLAFLMNLSQPSLLALRTSLPNMAKGIFNFLGNPHQSWMAARELGIYADMAQRTLMQEMAGGPTGWLTRWSLSGFNISEKFVRAIAAEAGGEWAKTIQARLADPKNVPWLIKELGKLNFTTPEVQRLLTTKTLTPGDVKLIQWSIADQVSFLPRPARKSEFYLTTPIGPVILQFKNFLMNTGRLLKQTVFDEAREGNMGPALRAASVVFPAMAVMGEVPADLNAALRGSKRPAASMDEPSSFLWRAVDNVSQVGALGLGMGLLQEMTGLRSDAWRSDLARFVVGPTVTSMAEELQHPGSYVEALWQGNEDEAERQKYETLRRVLRRTPYVGPVIANRVLPSTARPEVEQEFNVWDRLGLSRNAWEEYQLSRLRAESRGSRLPW